MFLLVVLLIVAAILMLSFVVIPLLTSLIVSWQKKKEKSIEEQLEQLFYDKNPKAIMRLYFILPPALALLGFLLSKSIIFVLAGGLLGLAIPNFMLKIRDVQRRSMFNKQILDAIMVLSSSLKGGLSLLQALEVLVEEMPAPMNQEIGLVVRENRMGVTLEESLRNLDKRMELEELNLVINSILVARETGGDLTKVLSRLSTTIRDNRKLKESIRTLTLQGRMQAMIMSFLPFLFIWWVLSFNRHHFDIMFETDTGRTILAVGVILEVVGLILIRKFSTIKV